MSTPVLTPHASIRGTTRIQARPRSVSGCSTRPACGRRCRTRCAHLDPRVMWHNPVMFVVEVGAVLCHGAVFHRAQRVRHLGDGVAVADRAVREPRRRRRRGPRQGAGRVAARVPGHRRPPGSSTPRAMNGRSRPPCCGSATWWSARPGDVIPGDGDIVEGVASVDESAITGESAPVVRESGGDRSSVTGGTRVLSDRIVIRITTEPGQVVRRPDDRAGRGLGAAEDAERDRAEHPAGQPDHRVPAGGHCAATDVGLRRLTAVDRHPGRACWSA